MDSPERDAAASSDRMLGGFSLTAINQLVAQLGLTPSEVIITRKGEVEVIRHGR